MRRTIYEESESLGKRVGRFIALLLIVFGITAAVVAMQRFSTETLAFLGGGIFAVIVIALPLAAIIFLGMTYLRFRQSRPREQQQMTIPPIIMQMPAQMPQLPYSDAPLTTEPRRWNVIGGDEDER